jgi:hypothetical protein
MLKSSLQRYVERAVSENIKSDVISKKDLTNVITDSLYSLITSSEFITHLGNEFGKRVQSINRSKGKLR